MKTPLQTIDISNEAIKESTKEGMHYDDRLSRDFITTTIDKVSLVLIDHQKNFIAKNGWLTPFALFLSILTTLITAEFQKSFGLEASIWKAIYFIGAIFSACWTVYKGYQGYISRKYCTVEYFINELTKGAKKKPLCSTSFNEKKII